ncbi:hypothetical protein E2C01_055109 [Portunus trituberculatus]|uniref:Uncharacterized protein n=1 Tax=Portunus trituberculatus TaxID=210409 RepID=A0A5B7GTX5_PORTR|nr:hypothetical protein [Portunus trituberculatus]
MSECRPQLRSPRQYKSSCRLPHADSRLGWRRRPVLCRQLLPPLG